MSSIPAQTCWGCRYFYFSAHESGYSEYTPGADFDVECLKKRWVEQTPRGVSARTGLPVFHTRVLEPRESRDDFAAAMEIGFTCTVYEPREA